MVVINRDADPLDMYDVYEEEEHFEKFRHHREGRMPVGAHASSVRGLVRKSRRAPRQTAVRVNGAHRRYIKKFGGNRSRAHA